MDSTETENITGADIVKDGEGRQYHIGLAPGELAENIVIVGDPDRPERTKHLFSDIYLDKRVREFRTITGKIDEMDISIMSTGIGTDNTEICLIEIMQICKSPTIIRAGSCGSLQEFIAIGDLVISTGSVRLEQTSTFFVPEGYPAIANFEVILALTEAAGSLNTTFHVGLTASAAGFYGAQGRKIPGLPLRFPNLREDLSNLNVYNMEMETSTLFNLSQILKLRAGSVCAVYAKRLSDEFIPNDKKRIAEMNCLETAITSHKILRKMDLVKKQANKKHWVPSLSLE
ncbi:MAG: nucleoside phosphorylase [Candidatus Hodarchaeales archaeon]